MSTQPPQVLSRKANGPSNDATGQQSDQAKTKGNPTGGDSSKPAKGRGGRDRRGAAAKAANDGEAAPKASRAKPHNEGEKLVVRRLPPGMTKDEFVSILGPAWEVSKGKVDWFCYVAGKISTDPSKPSRPGRAYIHLMRKDDIMPLSEVVRGATWEDAKATFTNPALIGPAALEFSIYKKVPSTKKRTDARQGTIDQDPEFMAFLEGLANPVPMRESIDVQDAEDSGKVENKVTTTPLVEFLKEKKANKNKEGSGKNSKSGKGKGGSKDDEASGRRKGKESRGDKQDKAPKETVKILTKKAAAEQAAEGAKKAAGQINAAANASTATTATTAGDAPKSRRAGIAAAARILQRDLGLSPGSAHRRARHDAAKAESDAKAAPSSNQDKETKGTATDSNATTPTSTASVETTAQAPKTRAEGQPASKSQSGRRTRGGKGAAEKAKVATIDTPATQQAPSNPPVILKKKQDAETGQKAAEPQPAAPATNSNGNGKQTPKEKANSNKQASQKKSANISANATRAFVKNVNASQGVNDASLREALGAFGTITFVEIDKRKGFAYVDFSENEALVKAAGASPLQVGQATVQVLERKDKKPAANAAPTTSGKDGNTANGDKEKEKSTSSRGRRGRGGGKAVAGAAASTANSQPTAAAASTGG